ncbi:MAG: hypothetical protein ACXVHY_09510 [Methanobacterium sp.]
MSIWVQIGRVSQECSGFSICHWGAGVRSMEQPSGSTLQIDENANSLIINISKESIIGKEQYFTGKTVNFEEAVIMPYELQKAIGSIDKITIGTGAYKLNVTKTGYQIVIPLK